MRGITGTLLCCLEVGVAWGLDAPKTAPPYSLVKVAHAAEESPWIIYNNDFSTEVDEVPWCEPGGQVKGTVFTGKPGKYALLWVDASGRRKVTVVVITGKAPDDDDEDNDDGGDDGNDDGGDAPSDLDAVGKVAYLEAKKCKDSGGARAIANQIKVQATLLFEIKCTAKQAFDGLTAETARQKDCWATWRQKVFDTLKRQPNWGTYTRVQYIKALDSIAQGLDAATGNKSVRYRTLKPSETPSPQVVRQSSTTQPPPVVYRRLIPQAEPSWVAPSQVAWPVFNHTWTTGNGTACVGNM